MIKKIYIATCDHCLEDEVLSEDYKKPAMIEALTKGWILTLDSKSFCSQVCRDKYEPKENENIQSDWRKGY